MKKDYYTYAKLELLDTARVNIAYGNDDISNRTRARIINEINYEYIQSINEAEGYEFDLAKKMISDIETSYPSDKAKDIIMYELFSKNYEFKKCYDEFSIREDICDMFRVDSVYNSPETVIDDVKYLARQVAEVANKSDLEAGYSAI